MPTFAQNLRDFREELGFTQVEVANCIGVSASTISEWETGKQFPKDYSIVKLCVFFRVTRARMLGEVVKDFDAEEVDLINQRRAFLRDADGRVKRETRFDSQGYVFREYWDLELTPAVWRKLQNLVKASGFENDVDGYLAYLVHEEARRMEQNEAMDSDNTKNN